MLPEHHRQIFGAIFTQSTHLAISYRKDLKPVRVSQRTDSILSTNLPIPTLWLMIARPHRREPPGHAFTLANSLPRQLKFPLGSYMGHRSPTVWRAPFKTQAQQAGDRIICIDGIPR